MVSTIAVEIVRVDKDTLKLLKYPLHVWPGTHEARAEGMDVFRRPIIVPDSRLVRTGPRTRP